MKTIIVSILIIGLITTLSHGQQVDTLSIKYYGKPIIQMNLNGKKAWVLLDTGSEISVLNTKSKDKYKFNIYEDYESPTVAGFGSTHNYLYHVMNAKLYFGNVELKSTFYAYNFCNIVNSIRARTGKTITAIIGTKVMQSYGFIIDLGNNRVSMAYKMTKRNLKPVKEEAEFSLAKSN